MMCTGKNHCRGKVRCVQIKDNLIPIDLCIARIVKALNTSAWCRTTSSCCGHDIRFGQIALEDGRVILIMPNQKSADALNPLLKTP